MTMNQYCACFLGALFFGGELLKVQEVLCYQEMTRVPLATNVVRGPGADQMTA